MLLFVACFAYIYNYARQSYSKLPNSPNFRSTFCFLRGIILSFRGRLPFYVAFFSYLIYNDLPQNIRKATVKKQAQGGKSEPLRPKVTASLQLFPTNCCMPRNTVVYLHCSEDSTANGSLPSIFSLRTDMRRLIIHPKDRTTDFLKSLYEGCEDAEVHTERLTSKEVKHLFHHCPSAAQIVLLGHGSDKGLFYRADDTLPDFDAVMVSHTHCHHLLQRHNTIGIFCNADLFARAEGLHGLFTGMIISELSEAEAYGIHTTQQELDSENPKFANRLAYLLRQGCLLHEIPARMSKMDDIHSELTIFNYSHLYYL